MQYVSHSSYLVGIEAIARIIYISMKHTKSCLRAQKYHKISGGHAPRPP